MIPARPRLLLVESDPEVLHVLPPFMARVGEVRCASTAEDGIGLVNEEPVDVLVAASGLLVTKGAALLRATKQARAFAQVLVLCEAEATEVPARIMAEGMVDTLVKPFDLAVLPSRLERLLEVMSEQQRRAYEQHEVDARMRHQERVALMGTLVATLVHDVASPLSVIVSNGGLVAEVVEGEAQISPEDRQFVQSATHDIIDAANTIKHYSARILRYSGTDKASRWDDDLLETLRMALLFVRARSRDQGVHVHYLPPDRPIRVAHHPAAFSQAVVNALSNGIDAAGSGGNVWLRVEDSAQELAVVVEDDGPGLTAEQEGRMCEAFFSTKPTGTGLGTVIIGQVMHEHGGRVTWRNIDGRGVCVTLTLPKRPSSLPPPDRFVTG